jgi:hypothetical protein
MKRYIKKFFIALSLFAVTGILLFWGFAKIYLIEKERCMLTHKKNFAQFHYKYTCNENHEYPLQQNKVLHHAVTVQ